MSETSETEIFHILSRGVDKRKIFLEDKDYLRFIHNLFEFNDQKKANTSFLHSHPNYVIAKHSDRKLLVQILSFCLMPNHYHLLLSPLVDNGITNFMKKLNIGYARYFNTKYERRGALFESRYKSIMVKDESHFIYLPYYIHLNPLDLITPEWRAGKIKNYKKAVEFLESYRWSSHLDYADKKNFPSVTHREFLMESFGGPGKYKTAIKEWIEDLTIKNIEGITLE